MRPFELYIVDIYAQSVRRCWQHRSNLCSKIYVGNIGIYVASIDIYVGNVYSMKRASIIDVNNRIEKHEHLRKTMNFEKLRAEMYSKNTWSLKHSVCTKHTHLM